MDGKSRVFRPEAEKIWHEDYQCEYYRGVIIDGEDNIVERCAKMHPNYTAAFSDAAEKMSVSPLYSRQTSPDMKKKLEEYKAKKHQRKKGKLTLFLIRENGMSGSIFMIPAEEIYIGLGI